MLFSHKRTVHLLGILALTAATLAWMGCAEVAESEPNPRLVMEHVRASCAGNRRCLVETRLNQEVELPVKVVDGNPRRDPVEFVIENDSGVNPTLSASSDYADESGVAEVTVTVSETVGSFEVATYVGGTPGVTFLVGVDSPSSAAYRVEVMPPPGGVGERDVVVRAHEAHLQCGNLETAQAVYQGAERFGPDGSSVTVVFPDIDVGTSFTFRAEAGSAHGCVDSAPPIPSSGESQDVTIELE